MAFIRWRGSDERGKFYGVWYERIGGKRKKKWKPLSRDKKTAERMLREIERNLDLKGAGMAQSVSWKQLRTEYLKFLTNAGCASSTLVRVGIILNHFERLYPITGLMDVTPKLLDDYKGVRKEEGIEPATINRELSAIKAAIKQARRWQYQAHDLGDVAKMKEVDKARECFTNADVQNMLVKADPMFRMLILLGLYAGLRREEMLQLRWRDVDWDRKVLVLGDGWLTKTRRIRLQPVGPELEGALRKWQGACGSRSERVIQWDRAPHQLSGMFTHFLRKRCGIAKGSLHALRHTFITRLAQGNVVGSKVQRLAGHTSGRTTEIYTHLGVEDLRESVTRLDYGEKDPPGSTDGSK